MIDYNKITIPSRKKITVGDYEITYFRRGSGTPLVCLPGWINPAILYTPLAEYLKEDNEVISLDLPGWGGPISTKMDDATVLGYTKIIEEFIKNLNLKKFHLLGHSYGGMLAQEILKRGVVKPDKVVLSSTIRRGSVIGNAFYIKPLIWIYRLAIKINFSKRLLKSFFINQGKIYMYLRGYRKRIYETKIFNAFIRESFNADIESSSSSIFSLFDHEGFTRKLKEGNILIIYGDMDLPFIKKGSDEIADLTGQKPVILKRGDHAHILTEVEKAGKVIKKFLN